MSSLGGKRILVTGGAGFLGRQVCRELATHDPAAMIAPRSAQFDLRKRDAIDALLSECAPDVVVHLAAVVGGIGANRLNPGRFFYENAIMGIELMEASRVFGVKKFVAVGSVCAYPKHTVPPFKEDDLWNGYPEETNAPYGLAKKMLLVQAQAYRQQYGLNAITLFPVNLYGPGDNFNLESSHVIPALIRKAIDARHSGETEIEIWGSGAATREFLFVRDAARAIVLAAELYDEPEPVNIGTGHEITIRDLANLICEICGFEGKLTWNAAKPDGQPRRCLDTARAKKAFGFTASTSLRDGLIETMRWYHEHRELLSNQTDWCRMSAAS